MDKFHELVEETKAIVRDQIVNRDNRPDYVLERQLYSILNELEKMDQIRNRDLFFSVLSQRDRGWLGFFKSIGK